MLGRGGSARGVVSFLVACLFLLFLCMFLRDVPAPIRKQRFSPSYSSTLTVYTRSTC